MSELDFGWVILWLVMGGSAFPSLAYKEDSAPATYAIFLFCLLLAPFAFGAGLIHLWREKRHG